MVFLNNQSRHAEWRKNAKKERRRRLRQARAQKRDADNLEEQKRLENSPTYQKCMREQQKLEEEKEKEEAAQACQREAEWKRVEEEAQKQWRQLQARLAQAREEKLKQNMKIKMEWEREQERLKKLKEVKEKEVEKKRLEQQEREQRLLDFLEHGGDTPEHLKNIMETNPGRDVCPFFQKVCACRFFDSCSRNHVRPGISHTLLITNFFSHMSLEIKENEHGSDSSLEFEKEDTFCYYKEFFEDVVSELEKCGRIKKFVACCNHEPHLRGNVYIQYRTTREALIAYHKFNGRFYAGRQLNVQFCHVPDWKNAICGLFFRNKCPKGNACNFLHIFRNPKNLYMHTDSERSSVRSSRRQPEPDSWDREDSCDRRSWRWSESPELSPLRRRGKKRRRESRDRRSESSRRRRR